jgi:hypothetical protein
MGRKVVPFGGVEDFLNRLYNLSPLYSCKFRGFRLSAYTIKARYLAQHSRFLMACTGCDGASQTEILAALMRHPTISQGNGGVSE